MKCRQVWKNLLAYIKREIEENLALDMEKHLARCKKCQIRKQEIVAHLKIYGQLSSVLPSAQGWQDLHRRILQPRPPQKLAYSPTHTSRSIYFGITALFALMVLFFSTYYFYRRSEWNIHVMQGKLRVNSTKTFEAGSILKLKDGTKIATGFGETANCRLRGKITIAFGGNTDVTLEASPCFLLRRGEVYVKSKDRELVVRTQQGKIYVTGTVFSVSCVSSLTTLAVYRGSVYFRNRFGSVLVREGELLESRSESAPKLSHKAPENYPWWVDAPISITLEAIRQGSGLFLCLSLKNTGSHSLTLAPFSGGTPRFFLHIKAQEKSYTVPLRPLLVSEEKTPMVIAPLASRVVKCDVSKETRGGGRYRFIAVYNGNGENNWKGIVASPPLSVNWD